VAAPKKEHREEQQIDEDEAEQQGFFLVKPLYQEQVERYEPTQILGVKDRGCVVRKEDSQGNKRKDKCIREPPHLFFEIESFDYS